MKWIGRILLMLVVVVVVAAVAVPFLVPLEAYRAPIERAASTAIGRTVRIEGPLQISIYPDIGVSLQQVTVSNADGARTPQMISIDTLIVGVRLMPLLSRRVEVSRLILQRPVIHLEISGDGTPNFGFAAPGPAAALGPVAASSPAAAPGPALANVSINNVRITEGQVSYFDARSGREASFDDVTISFDMPAADSPAQLDGALTYNGQRLNVTARVENPAALAPGPPGAAVQGTQATLELDSNILTVTFQGNLTLAGASTGMLDLSTPSLRNLASWAGAALPPGGVAADSTDGAQGAPGENLAAMAITSTVAVERNRYTFSNLEMRLDAMTLTGDLVIDTGGAVPVLTGALGVDQLNFNTYLTAGDAPARVAGAGPSTTPIELGILAAVNADLELEVGQMFLQQLTIGQTSLGLQLDNGVMTVNLRSLSLYGGNGTGTFVIDARGDMPTFRNTLQVTGLQVQPFLADLIDVDRIEAEGTLNLTLASRGNTEQAILNALSGNGSMDFRNGRLRGVDLAAIARAIQNLASGQNLGNLTGETAQTDFSEMGGTFVIENGVVHNNDFHLLNPFVRITGNGQVDLANRTLDFYLDPRAVASVQGQGGQAGVQGIGIAFRVHGPWTDLSYVPDTQAIGRAVIEQVISGASPLDALIGGNPLGALFGGGNQNQDDAAVAPDEQPSQAPNPEDLLRGLFSR